MMGVARLGKRKPLWIVATLCLLLMMAALVWWQVQPGTLGHMRAMLFGVPLATDNTAAVTAMDSQNVRQPLARLGDGRSTQVVFDQQGTRLAVATDIGLYLYDATTFARVHFWATATPVQSVAFAADGAEIAFSTMSENQKLYRGRLTESVVNDDLTVLDLNESLMHGLAYSPDGAYLVGVSFYHLFIWDAVTLELLVSHEQSSALTKQVIFSPDGRLLAMLYKDTLELWQLDGGLLLETVTLPEGHYFGAETATFAPDSGEIIAAGLREPRLYAWAITADGRLGAETVRSLRNNIGTVTALQFTPDGAQLAVGFADGKISLLDRPWVVETPPVLQSNGLDQLAWSASGRLLAAGIGDGVVHLWPMAAPEQEKMLHLPDYAAGAHARHLQFAGDNNTLTAVTTTGAVYQWRLDNGELLHSLEQHSLGRLNSVAFLEDGTQLVVGAENGAVQRFDRTQGLVIEQFYATSGHIDAVRPAPAAGQFAVATSQSVALGMWADPVYLGELSAEIPFTTLDTDDTGFVTSCGIYWNNAVFSADGHHLATTAYAHKALLWRVADGTLLHTFEGHTSAILDIALSPDGALLATASDDEEVRIWQTGDGTLQTTLPGHAGGAVAVAFAPDGQALATRSAFGDVRLWSLDGHKEQQLLADVRNPRSNLAFSPDGAWLASGGRGNRVYLWRVTEQGTDPAQVYLLEGHNGIVNEVAFAPDGALLATASDDGTVALWQVPSH